MKSALRVILSALLPLGCASHSPIQIGTGEVSPTEVISCTDYIIGFPTNNFRRVDQTLTKNNLSPSDIYSLEDRTWWYLFPFYLESCTVARLNTVGAAKIASRPASRASLVDKSEPMADEFSRLGGVAKCDSEYKGLIRDRCRQYYAKLKGSL